MFSHVPSRGATVDHRCGLANGTTFGSCDGHEHTDVDPDRADRRGDRDFPGLGGHRRLAGARERQLGLAGRTAAMNENRNIVWIAVIRDWKIWPGHQFEREYTIC